jgi:glycosyltransferase involved in cell wall biosynthesis
LKVLFVSWRDLAHPNAGGSEVEIDRLITGLRSSGHEAMLLCGGPIGPSEYPVVRTGGTYDQYLRAPFVARRYRDWDLLVDVVNGFPFFSPVWWRGPRLCLFNHLHGEQWDHYFPTPVAQMGSFVERRVLPALYRSTTFAAISDSTADALAGIGIDRSHIHVIHLGLDEAALDEPVPEADEPTFAVLGRVARNKGLDRVLDAWERVEPETGGRLVFIGDGPERARLEARNQRGVEFVGRISEAEKLRWLGESWLLVHGAYREGWGLVILEAAAQATPTVAFDVEGVRDALIDGETGVMVETPEQFTAAWLDLARDRSRRLEMGRQARERAQGYTWDATIAELLKAGADATESVR